MTYLQIKLLVEKITGINDLSTNSRKRFIADARFVYFAICHRYGREPHHSESFSLKRIGELVGRDRTTVIHGLNEFQSLKRDRMWHGGWLYDLCIERMKRDLREALISQSWKPEPKEVVNCIETEFAIVK